MHAFREQRRQYLNDQDVRVNTLAEKPFKSKKLRQAAGTGDAKVEEGCGFTILGGQFFCQNLGMKTKNRARAAQKHHAASHCWVSQADAEMLGLPGIKRIAPLRKIGLDGQGQPELEGNKDRQSPEQGGSRRRASSE